MIHFLWPWMFVIAPLPLLLRRYWSAAQGEHDGAITVPFYAAVAALAAPRGAQRGVEWRGITLLFLLWLMLLAAAARPQRLGEASDLPVTGRDMLLAVDTSGSMEVPDLELKGKPATRLQVVQAVAGDFIERRAGDRVGLILFGKRAYLQTPLTFDRSTTRAMLDEAEIGLAGKETAIGDAIGLAVKQLRDLPQDSRVLVLLTDGANTAGELTPAQGATLAAQFKVRIYSIGVGADSMDVSAVMGGGSGFNFGLRPRIINPSADLDEKLLTHIADTTGGRYFRARDTAGLEEIYRLLDKLEPHARLDEVIRPVTELYYWPLGAAFTLALLLGMLRVMRLAPARTALPVLEKR